jgi:hypothetical protein
MQRFGRCARDTSYQGVAILIAETKWFYNDSDEETTRQGKKRKSYLSALPDERPRKVPKSQHTSIMGSPPNNHSNSIEGEDPAGRADKVAEAIQEYVEDRYGEHDADEVGSPRRKLEGSHMELVDEADGDLIGHQVDVGQGSGSNDTIIDGTHLDNGEEIGSRFGGLPVVGREASPPWKVVSEDMIKMFVGGKNPRTKAGTKVKDIDDYLKLFINAHHLPRNARCRRKQSNKFFGNNSTCTIGISLTCYLNHPSYCSCGP